MGSHSEMGVSFGVLMWEMHTPATSPLPSNLKKMCSKSNSSPKHSTNQPRAPLQREETINSLERLIGHDENDDGSDGGNPSKEKRTDDGRQIKQRFK